MWQQKLKAVLKDLDEGVFGHQVGRICVVELQKRGLPHAHILIILGEENKPRTRQDYDRFVSAELPDPETHPALYNTVITTMLHGPCGDLRRSSPCMKDGKCSKGYPKPLAEITQTNPDGFPVYRRRRRPEGVLEHNGKRFDNTTINQWVVPYNPYFSQKYNCHINVEVCSSIVAVKYLYKYVYKGSDMTEIGAEATRRDTGESGDGVARPMREPNEIIRYIKARYISPVEACKRLLEYPIQGKTHAVVMLNVHLPDNQFVTFHRADDPAQVLQQGMHTKLTRFFELCGSEDAENLPAKSMLYQDIPKLFRWNKKEKQWFRYQRSVSTLGRMVHCSPRDPERCYLRVMLCYKKGPKSFEDLRTVDGHVCATFKEAAMRAGYLANDREWDRCLDEASAFRMPYQLRQLFATILLFSQPADVRTLWDKYYVELSRDFAHAYRAMVNKDEMVKFHTLKGIHEFLMAGGMALSDFDLPQLSEFPRLVLQSLFDNNLIRRELEGYDTSELRRIVECENSLNDNQRLIYDKVVAAVEQPYPENKLFFIDGPGGTGKSTLLKHVLARVRHIGRIAIAVASSGIASLLLPGGRTAHSAFKIPLKTTKTSTCFIPKQSKLKGLIEAASVIIWDEAPMTHRFAFEAVDRTLRDLLDVHHEPFGGKVVVLSGDFRQILPVVKKGTPSDTVDACLKSSELWTLFSQEHLTVNMRVQGAANEATAAELAEFSEFLLQVGEGRHEVDPILGEDFIKLPRDMVIENPAYDPEIDGTAVDFDKPPIPVGLKRIIDAMYSEDDLNNPDIATDEYFAQRTVLTPTNAAVQRVNEAVADRLRGEPQEYLFTDAVQDEDGHAAQFFETEVLHSISINGIPPHRLVLKKGAPVMMVRNLNPDAGLCNGTRLRVVELKAHVIHATVMTGEREGQHVLIPRIIFISDDDNRDFPFRLRRKQFPVVSAFAMTINKAQGQTVQNLGLYLPSPCFSYGQLYVLSRVTSRSKFKALIDSPEKGEEDGVFTDDIVYRQIFE